MAMHKQGRSGAPLWSWNARKQPEAQFAFTKAKSVPEMGADDEALVYSVSSPQILVDTDEVWRQHDKTATERIQADESTKSVVLLEPVEHKCVPVGDKCVQVGPERVLWAEICES